MAELPKIAVQRLKTQPAHQPAHDEPAGGLTASHPDANLLTGFAEKTLADRERSVVLAHLALCGTCRAIVSLAQPEIETVASQANAPAPQESHWWPALRWGGLAAALASVAIVVALQRRAPQAPPMLSKQTPPVLEASKGPAPPLPVPPGAQRSQPETLQRKVSPGYLSTDKELSKLDAGLAAQNEKRALHLSRAKGEEPSLTLMASARQPAPVPLVSPAGEDAARARLVRQLPSTPPQGAQVAPPANEPALDSATQHVAVSGAAIQVSPGEEVVPPAPEAKSAQVRVESHAAELMGGAARGALKSKVSPTVVRWNITSDGALQRSDDRGKTWAQVQVGASVKFRAVSTDGSNVWAGGEQGALYHSLDAGANWRRVTIEPDGAFAQTVVDIQVRDPQHVVLGTSAGQHWASNDGGQTWQREP